MYCVNYCELVQLSIIDSGTALIIDKPKSKMADVENETEKKIL